MYPTKPTPWKPVVKIFHPLEKTPLFKDIDSFHHLYVVKIRKLLKEPSFNEWAKNLWKLKILRMVFLGGGREISRSAVWVSGKEASILLDYGVDLGDREPKLPLSVPPKKLDAIVLSHAHLDHAGAIPLLYASLPRPLYVSSLTVKLLEILLKDFMNLSKYYVPYEYSDVELMLNHVRDVDSKSMVEVKEAKLSFRDSGHIPGSLQVLMELNGKKLLYTSDLNTIETRLMRGAEPFLEELDVVIIEATYAGVNHPDRRELEKEFVKSIENVVESGGTVLIPAFSVGRAQEVLCILKAHSFSYEVYLDGMARAVSRMFMEHPQYFKDFNLLKRALEEAIWIGREEGREKAYRKPGVIVCPAGMLKGGPAIYYLRKIANGERNAIFLVCHQVAGTPGHTLLNTGKFPFDGGLKPIKALVRGFDFSSHVGHRELWDFLKQLKGSPKVFIVHGEEEKCTLLASQVSSGLGLEASSPRNGESFEV